MADIPSEILALVEREPIEDLVLAILRAGMPGMEIVSLISKNQNFPVILVRRYPNFLGTGGDDRFVEVADISVHAFALDPDGDRDAARLSDAVRVLLRDAAKNQFGNAELGWVKSFETLANPRRVPDWATANGPVQYASLPSNTSRYEGRFRLSVRTFG